MFELTFCFMWTQAEGFVWFFCTSNLNLKWLKVCLIKICIPTDFQNMPDIFIKCTYVKYWLIIINNITLLKMCYKTPLLNLPESYTPPHTHTEKSNYKTQCTYAVCTVHLLIYCMLSFSGVSTWLLQIVFSLTYFCHVCVGLRPVSYTHLDVYKRQHWEL